MAKNLYLFDMDGTLTESTMTISPRMGGHLAGLMKAGHQTGIVGGGMLGKIRDQLNGLDVDHIFSECGSTYHRLVKDTASTGNFYKLIYQNKIRDTTFYPEIQELIKEALRYLSRTDFPLGGHHIDIRNGLIYISLAGMTANAEERECYITMDKRRGYRQELIGILRNRAEELDIHRSVTICEGGSVGISIYPAQWDKVQVLDRINLDEYDRVYYFGDKYNEDGNDHKIINDLRITGIRVNSPKETDEFLSEVLSEL